MPRNIAPETKLDIAEVLLLLIGLGACLSTLYLYTILLAVQ